MPARMLIVASAAIIASSFWRGALAQTPPGYTPTTNMNLPVSIGGINITPGELIPVDSVFQSPVFNLSVPSVVLTIALDNPAGPVSGEAPYLHGLTSTSNATVVSWIPPTPPKGIEPRFLLLEYTQPYSNGTFQLPAAFNRDYDVNGSLNTNRLVFDTKGFIKAAGLGELKAANWFQVLGGYNVSNATNGTAVPSATPSQYTGGAGKLAGHLGFLVVGTVAAVVIL